jgi:uncharacterized repeat protein (TIGR01451 family)
LPLPGLKVLAQDEVATIDAVSSLEIVQPLTGMSDPDFKVVRVYFDSRQPINELVAWIEPWEINYEEGYLVLGIDSIGFNRLLAQGYRIEVDEAFTEVFNRPPENFPEQVNGIPGYPCYRTVEETFATAAEIATDHPQLATWLDIGNSWEKETPGGLSGYDIKVLRLTNSAILVDKPKLFIMTAIHAREYATAELNTRFAEYLIANYETNPDITWLLDYTEIHLLLIANPDGRKHAENGIYWRKNTNENYCSPTSNFRGADLNRNFEFQWGCCGGSSTDACSEVYRGPTEASEPEVQAIQNYVRTIFPDQRLDDLNSPANDDATGIFIDIHSYGELVIWPWGFTDSETPNGVALQTLGRKFAYFNDYVPYQAYELYPTDGNTDDFAYGELGLAAYTFELGTTFFQLCSTFENTILPDNLPALIYAAKVSNQPYLTPSGPDTVDITLLSDTVTSGDPITLNATMDDTRYSNKNGIETSQNIVAAEAFVDIHPWEVSATNFPLLAADGAFDAPIETVIGSVDSSGLTEGRHIIYVRGQDADGNWGAISAAFVNIEAPDTFSLEKTVSIGEVSPGEIFTYTLEAQLTMTGTNSFTLTLTDTLPSEVTVLTDSLRVNGSSANDLYAPVTHSIHYEASGNFTESYRVEITFQVQVGDAIHFWTEINNRLDGRASINEEQLIPLQDAESSVIVINPDQKDIFFPIIFHQN